MITLTLTLQGVVSGWAGVECGSGEAECEVEQGASKRSFICCSPLLALPQEPVLSLPPEPYIPPTPPPTHTHLLPGKNCLPGNRSLGTAEERALTGSLPLGPGTKSVTHLSVTCILYSFPPRGGQYQIPENTLGEFAALEVRASCLCK